MLLFDEPVNRLDPDGIRWVRNLLKGLAREGRTVFVSSHLMSEMAVTADEVVIIGKGRLISQIPIDELLAQSSQRFVRVRSPEIARLKEALEGGGATTVLEDDGSLSVRGTDEATVGELAASLPVVLHLLAPQSASLSRRPSWSSPRTVSSTTDPPVRAPAPRGSRAHEHLHLQPTNGDQRAAARALRNARTAPIGVDEAANRPLDGVDARSHGRARHRHQRARHRGDEGPLDAEQRGGVGTRSARA